MTPIQTLIADAERQLKLIRDDLRNGKHLSPSYEITEILERQIAILKAMEDGE